MWIKTAYIIHFLSGTQTLKIEELPHYLHNRTFQRWLCRRLCLRDTRELMYISHPFYNCFNSLSGPFRSYACRSCLLKLVLINCILWKSAACTSEMYYSLFAFLITFQHPSNICSYAMKRALIFASKRLFLLYKTSILMKKWQQWVFINVMYYSTAFLKCYFQRNVSYFFAFCVVHISAWMVLQSKQSCFIFYIFTL